MALTEYILDPLGSAVAVSFAGAGGLAISDANWAMEPVAADWLWWGWLKLTNKTNGQAVIGKYNGGANQRSYTFNYNQSIDRFQLAVSSDGLVGTVVSVNADVLGSPSAGVWYFFEFGRIGSTISLRMTPASSGSRNAANTAAYAGNTFNGTAPLEFGVITTVLPMSGQIGQAYYKQGTLPNSTVLDACFNAGAGLSKRAYLAAGHPTPNAAFEFEEASGNRRDWVNGKLAVPSGTVSYSAGWPFDVDFTSPEAANAYASANKVAGDEWIFNCYSGASLTTESLFWGSIPTNSDGWVRLRAASGHYHDADSNAGAYLDDLIIVSSQSFCEVSRLRCEAGIYSINGASSTGRKFDQNLVVGQIIADAGSSLTELEITNNLIFTDSQGIFLSVNGTENPASLAGLVAHNTVIGDGATTSGVYIEATEGVETESIDLELYNNVLVEHGDGNGIYVTGTFDSETIDSQANATSDSTGEIPDVEPSEIFVDFDNSDYDTLLSGPTYRAGVAAGVLDDILDRSRSLMHPDCGCFETTLVPPGSGSCMLLLGVS